MRIIQYFENRSVVWQLYVGVFFLRLRSSVVTAVAGAGCFRACSWLVLNAKNLIGILFMIAGVRACVCMILLVGKEANMKRILNCIDGTTLPG